MNHNQEFVTQLTGFNNGMAADDLTALNLTPSYSPSSLVIDASQSNSSLESFESLTGCFSVSPFSHKNKTEQRYLTPSENCALLSAMADPVNAASSLLLLIQAQDLAQLSNSALVLHSLAAFPVLIQVAEACQFMADIQQQKRLTNNTVSAPNDVTFYDVVSGSQELKGAFNSLASFKEGDPVAELKAFAQERNNNFDSLVSAVSVNASPLVNGLSMTRFDAGADSVSIQLKNHSEGLPQTPYSFSLLLTGSAEVITNIEGLFNA